MDKNESLLRRLEQFDSSRIEEPSVRLRDGDSSTYREQRHVSLKLPVSQPFAAENISSPRDFEIALEQTRVYARVQSNDCDGSFSSSAVRTNAWSMLSGLSLNDISVVSVIALPIFWEEVNRMGNHLTFAKLLSGVNGPDSVDGGDSSKLPASLGRRIFRVKPFGGRRLSSPEETKAKSKSPPGPNLQTPPRRQPPRKISPGKTNRYTRLTVLGDSHSGKTEVRSDPSCHRS